MNYRQAKNYARSLLEVARKSGEMEEVAGELLQVNHILRLTPEIGKVSSGPLLAAAQVRALMELLADKVQARPLVRNFLLLLGENRLLRIFPFIVEHYFAGMDRVLGRVRVQVRTALPLRQEQQDRLRQKLAALLGKTIILEETVDARLGGGVVVNVGDRVYDGSLATRLRTLRSLLVKE